MVARVNKNWSFTPKDKATSPTTTLESVPQTTTVNIQEYHVVDTINIPNLLIQKNVGDKFINIISRGKFADLMARITENIYQKYITIEDKGNVVFYIRILKDVYGTMNTALIFCLNLIKDIKSKFSS